MKFDKDMLLLYAVTDRAWVGRQSLMEQVKEALQAGVTLLQIREKNMEPEAFLEEVRVMKALAALHQVPVIVNDSVEIAMKADADGVHVGQSDMEAGDVRAIIGPDKILGVTARTVEEARRAEARGADYLGAGAVFGSATKTDASYMDMETLKAICRSVRIPVVAIGGIGEQNIMKLQGSGVCGAAVVSAVFGAEDITKATRQLREKAEQMVGGDR